MNRAVDQKEVIAYFKLKPAPRGWYDGDCVFCGKEGHMGVKFDGGARFNCFKCKEAGDMFKLLKKVGRLDLLGSEQISPKEIISKKINFSVPKVDTFVPECRLPLGFRYVSSNEYLDSRGFTREQYDIFSVGVADTNRRFKDRVIFVVKEGGVPKGYLGRSTWSSDEIDSYNMWKASADKHRRYVNSVTDFGRLLFGIDEITAVTSIAIVVEGVTDKKAVDLSLGLYEREDIKCVASFGKKLSVEQATKLAATGVEEVVIMYDPDAISIVGSTVSSISGMFKRVSAAVPLTGSDIRKFILNKTDIGDLQGEYVSGMFSSRINLMKAIMLSKLYK